MAALHFEYLTCGDYDDYKTIAANLAGFAINIERHKNWLTTAYWRLPDEYGLEDFLNVVEGVFQEAEANGYEPNVSLSAVVCSEALEAIETVQYIRPLVADDFKVLDLEADQVSFLRLGDDLAHFTFSRDDRQVGVLFHEKPHQTRSAFRFMAELMPSALGLEPKQIGDFVLGLPR